MLPRTLPGFRSARPTPVAPSFVSVHHTASAKASSIFAWREACSTTLPVPNIGLSRLLKMVSTVAAGSDGEPTMLTSALLTADAINRVPTRFPCCSCQSSTTAPLRITITALTTVNWNREHIRAKRTLCGNPDCATIDVPVSLASRLDSTKRIFIVRIVSCSCDDIAQITFIIGKIN